MTLDELVEKIDQILTGQNVFWKHREVLELLVKNTGDDKAVSLKDDQQIGRTWGWTVEKLFILRFPQVALQTAEKLYEIQLEAQEALNERLHKGVALQVTGETYLQLHRFSLAKRYFQLALIEDTIEHRENVSSDFPSYKSLTRDLNIPSADLDQLTKFTLEKIGQYNGFCVKKWEPVSCLVTKPKKGGYHGSQARAYSRSGSKSNRVSRTITSEIARGGAIYPDHCLGS